MRPEILFPLFAPITSLKGVGARVSPLLERLAGKVVRDVLFLSPQRIVRRNPCVVSGAAADRVAIIEVTIERHQRPARPSQPWKIRVCDDTGFMTLVFFQGAGPHLERQHPPGARRLVSGRVELERFGGAPQMVHPDYLLPTDRADEIPHFEAVYPATAGLASKTVRRFAHEALERTPRLPEWQDQAWLRRQGWPPWREAMVALHTPKTEADLSPSAAPRQRLAFDELLAHQLALAQRKRQSRNHPAPVIETGQLARVIETALPFSLTGAQHRILDDIRRDLASGRRMTRLIQGDVGAGKTVVAMLAMADAAGGGGQSALMAPTEILARQHFETIAPPLAARGVETMLLTGRDKGAARVAKLQRMLSGDAAVTVGTHALFQDDVLFHNLALTIIDEQHRFGVSERARLQAKGPDAHLLAMSATPIPRTLELTMFGDMDISRLDEKPPGRLPVATRATPMSRTEQIIARLRAAISKGAQAFWICPLIAESEADDMAAAEARATKLREIFGSAVGLVHGRLSSAEKDAVMADFAESRLSILVATTVVEVGVDVPSATIMVIERAERFGLAQLHQLRGRVGRGSTGGSCVLLYDPPLSQLAARRLDILRRTEDGFDIAEKDLELRGGGDPLGLRQSGFPDYRFADPAAHGKLVGPAADYARLTLVQDPEFTTQRGAALRLLEELFDWKARIIGREAD